MTSYNTTQLLRTRKADEIVPRVAMKSFVDGRNVHVLASPAAEVPLTIPHIVNIQVEDVRIQTPASMPAKPAGFFPSVQAPEMTVTRLSEVCCLPGGLAITADDIIPVECFSAPWECHYHHGLETDPDGYRLKQPVDARERLAGKYFLADYMHLEHYGHFLVDVVTRYWGLVWCREVLGIQDIKLLLRPGLPSYVRSILAGLGISADAIVEIDHPVIVEELFVATKSFQIQEFTSPLAAASFRRIRDVLAHRKDTPRRIYLSRSGISTRPLTDETMVEAAFRKRGFSVVHPETLPVEDQITLVANADLIAGTSGSNMFNLAFQRELKSSFVLVSPELLHWSDVFLQAYHDSAIHYFFGRVDPSVPTGRPGYVNSPWCIDLQEMEAAADRWLAANGVPPAEIQRPNWNMSRKVDLHLKQPDSQGSP